MNVRTKGSLAVFAVVAVAITALGWWVFDGSTTRPRTIRSRLTLVVETPEGERSGSTVLQDTIGFPGGLTRAQGWGLWVQLVGEAAVIDLGQRGLLVATLRKQEDLTRSGGGGSGGGYNPGLMPFPPEKFHYPAEASVNEKYAAYIDELNRLKPKSELSLKDVPVLVRFGNPNDPTSAALVDALDLAASFGPGVTFKGATVEITDDPITKGIETRFPWLRSSKFSDRLFPAPDPRLGSDQKPPLVRRLTYDDFRSLPR